MNTRREKMDFIFMMPVATSKIIFIHSIPAAGIHSKRKNSSTHELMNSSAV
jgi:hypothetical protein